METTNAIERDYRGETNYFEVPSWLRFDRMFRPVLAKKFRSLEGNKKISLVEHLLSLYRKN